MWVKPTGRRSQTNDRRAGPARQPLLPLNQDAAHDRVFEIVLTDGTPLRVTSRADARPWRQLAAGASPVPETQQGVQQPRAALDQPQPRQ